MRILFLGHLKDVVGRPAVEWRLDGALDADGLWRRLTAEFPDLGASRDWIRLARNYEYVGGDARFADTDEVALIPPVSGG